MALCADGLEFALDGAERLADAMSGADLVAIERLLTQINAPRAGVRLNGCPGLGELVGPASAPGRLATAALGADCRPVRAVLFDKTPQNNWSLGWHQDRTVVTRERLQTPGFGPWSVQQGLHHVEPPFEVLAGMATLRIHLDDVGPGNAPLKVAPGSHLLGRVPVASIPAAVARCGEAVCLARRGDIWAYSTPILHGSDPTCDGGRRRVLQVDYSTCDLPGGLEWLGV